MRVHSTRVRIEEARSWINFPRRENRWHNRIRYVFGIYSLDIKMVKRVGSFVLRTRTEQVPSRKFRWTELVSHPWRGTKKKKKKIRKSRPTGELFFLTSKLGGKIYFDGQVSQSFYRRLIPRDKSWGSGFGDFTRTSFVSCIIVRGRKERGVFGK